VACRSGASQAELRLHANSVETLEGLESRLKVAEEDGAAVKADLGELMYVYDDIQDRLYDIDRKKRDVPIAFALRTN